MDKEKRRILAVSNEPPVLERLNDILKNIFPNSEVILQTDPLMACKYSFENEVDYAFATEKMKRMCGIDLLRFIKKDNPEAKTYLVYEESAFSVRPYEDYDGMVLYPLTFEKMAEVLKVHK